MTPSGGLSVLVSRAARALREAGDDGLSLDVVAVAVGTRWPGRVIHAMRRAGYVVIEHAGRFYLEGEPEPDEGSSSASTGVPVRGDRADAGTPVDAGDLRLFDGVPRVGHYDVEAA